ncbi:hypothetical protein BCY86_03840 [Pajaroellobacter abortibovis]|uniref:Uncharacterized protein n=2 Tax=Pajaroellobacter abortibovis TaxID=1882918 RepID=A0A1L6MWW3_9BACT|nr:hypothetical protein BCY86_03840 [Pajaroellobacter abortibovis]
MIGLYVFSSCDRQGEFAVSGAWDLENKSRDARSGQKLEASFMWQKFDEELVPPDDKHERIPPDSRQADNKSYSPENIPSITFKRSFLIFFIQ